MTKQIFEVRRENLRRLVLDKYEGNRAAYSRAAGVHQNQVNLLLTDNLEHRRNLGEALARKMESDLGVAAGFFDVDHAGGAGNTFSINSPELVAPLSSVFRRCDMVSSVVFTDSFAAAIAPRVTDKANVIITKLTTKDMEPEIRMEATLLVDTEVKAVTLDGVYILTRGSDVFLRRVTKQLVGGWCISSGVDKTQVDSMKGFKVSGRVIAEVSMKMI